jgi:hypothetical protein
MYSTTIKTWTSCPEDWPQKRFKEKSCKNCGKVYKPNSPCNLYCSEECSKKGKASAYLKRSYNISLRDYEKMLKEQKSLCAICKTEGWTMAEHHNLKLVVDHCHTTGIVRGLLCHNCNRALGLLQDSQENLENAIDYLKGATTIPEGSTLKRVEAPSTDESQ